jgi:DNA adenine methylase
LRDRPFLKVRPAISWPGGKSRLLKWILPLIPKHVCYCEPFAGGMAVLLAKPRSAVEVVNDINGDLVKFYRCVRFHPDVLLGLTDIQRAARWFFRNKTCFGGANMNSFGTGATGGSASLGSRASRMEAIRSLSFRLDRVCIEHVTWEKCLDLYDRPATFFFLDPPYTECKPDQYGAWTNTDVQILRDRIDKLRGKWLLTFNDTAAIRMIFSDCKLTPVSRARGISNKAGKAPLYHELIIRPK